MIGIKKVKKVCSQVWPCFGLSKLPTGPGQCGWSLKVEDWRKAWNGEG